MSTFGESFTMNGSNDEGLELSDSFKAALAAKFPDSVADEPEPLATEPEVLPETPTPDAAEGGSGGPPSATPPAPTDPLPGLPDPEGGVGDVPPIDGGLAIGGIVEGDSVPDPNAPIGQAPTATGTPTTPTADELDLNDLFTRWTGRKPTSAEMTNLFGFVDSVAALNPTQRQQLDMILAGQDITQATFGTPTPSPSPTPPPSADLPDLSHLAPDDPARVLLEPVYAQLAAQSELLQQQQVASHQAQLAQQQQQYQAAAAQGSQRFISTYGPYLSANDMVLLEAKASRSGNINAYLAQTNGDMASAYHAMLEAAVYSDPAMRDRVIAAQTQASQAAAIADAQRQQRAAAVSAGGNPAAATPTGQPSKTAIDTTKGKRAGTRTKAEIAAAQREASRLAAEELRALGLESALTPDLK